MLIKFREESSKEAQEKNANVLYRGHGEYKNIQQTGEVEVS